ncbi:hypothetical protein D9753_00040 (plasmid) [Streptomyces dangxiongensis]|uniref:Uncharacterized protein n=1 Tax=Streptomyces dangxiongensis TaxID=1442032 RepID=A0A3G2JCZ6_9ACTN|nr:hypothetical protein D9753_00040 [Streptomyces dangxiongensis]
MAVGGLQPGQGCAGFFQAVEFLAGGGDGFVGQRRQGAERIWGRSPSSMRLPTSGERRVCSWSSPAYRSRPWSP